MQQLKFQSILQCQCNGKAYEYTSNELNIPVVKKTTIKRYDIPHQPTNTKPAQCCISPCILFILGCLFSC